MVIEDHTKNTLEKHLGLRESMLDNPLRSCYTVYIISSKPKKRRTELPMLRLGSQRGKYKKSTGN